MEEGRKVCGAVTSRTCNVCGRSVQHDMLYVYTHDVLACCACVCAWRVCACVCACAHALLRSLACVLFDVCPLTCACALGVQTPVIAVVIYEEYVNVQSRRLLWFKVMRVSCFVSPLLGESESKEPPWSERACERAFGVSESFLCTHRLSFIRHHACARVPHALWYALRRLTDAHELLKEGGRRTTHLGHQCWQDSWPPALCGSGMKLHDARRKT